MAFVEPALFGTALAINGETGDVAGITLDAGTEIISPLSLVNRGEFAVASLPATLYAGYSRYRSAT
jgi:hypothetical protein